MLSRQPMQNNGNIRQRALPLPSEHRSKVMSPPKLLRMTITPNVNERSETGYESLRQLTTEARNPASTDLDSLSAVEIVRLMNREDATVALAVGRETDSIARAIDVIAQRMRQGGRLIYVGAGTSGRLGVLDAAECPPTFNSPPGQVVGVIAGGSAALTRAVEGAEDRPELAVADLEKLQIGPLDVVVGIATSGRTPYVLAALRRARECGAFTIGLSCNADSVVPEFSDLTITPVVGPEILSGSTRLKAGTATKMVLNMLSTGAMVRLGKALGNLMVDLRATNTKLRDRARRIIEAVTGLAADPATQLLTRCDGEVKTAIVVHHRSVTPEIARDLLRRSQGRIRRALDEHGPIPSDTWA
jgi:N-acetylmuramic acid 6-phosphate etherase